MTTYIITSIFLITYSDRKIPLDVVGFQIQTKPLKIVKGKLLDSFPTMEDIPVNAEIKIKRI